MSKSCEEKLLALGDREAEPERPGSSGDKEPEQDPALDD
jgi:hypothetical protein